MNYVNDKKMGEQKCVSVADDIRIYLTDEIRRNQIMKLSPGHYIAEEKILGSVIT
jgi:hypothetical protein